MIQFPGQTGASHGGIDSGAVGNGLKEKDLTLSISKYMYDRFNELGIPVALTRDSDITLTSDDRPKIALSKFGNDKDVIIISNHINAGGANGCYCKLINFFTISTIWITNSVIKVFKCICF